MTCAEALGRYLRKYERGGGRAMADVSRRVDRLRDFFGSRPVAGLHARDLEAYADARAREGVSDSTIRPELAAFRRALKLAYVPVPMMPELAKSPPRRGYLSIDDFCRLRDALPPALRRPMTFAYLTGWRLRSEVLTLRKDGVNLEAGTVSIPTSKNGEPRVFPIDLAIPRLGSLRGLLEEAVQEAPESPLVFTRAGRPIRAFRDSWRNACRASGLHVRPHDLRRSAATNIHRAGVPMKVAMKLVGHRTITTHMDYIVEDDSDLREAVRQFEAFHRVSR